MNRIRRFWGLSGQKQRLLIYACLLLNGIRLALWLFSFNFVRRRLGDLSTVWTRHPVGQPVSVALVAGAVAIAGRYTPGTARCLVRALTTQALLDHYGYPHQLHIGVMKNDLSVEAHAWIEYQGRVVVGGLDNLQEFKPLVPLAVGGMRR